mmetsp:Transcript_16460/g.37962  ORF Transcript_16460/g.37962 Transcript_16460/m.37962 type:complete len:223 (+) Transcript_16460:131-799(+)
MDSRTDVALSVYSLHGAGVLNSVCEHIGLGGAYHVGVELYCLEWSYGWCAEGTGVYNVSIGCSPEGQFKERIRLGRTPFAAGEVMEILGELRRQWPGQSYHPLRQNCVHFSAELVRQLRIAEFPEWANSLATVLRSMSGWLDSPAAAAAQLTTAELRSRLTATRALSIQHGPQVNPKVHGDTEQAELDIVSLQQADWEDAQEYMFRCASQIAVVRGRRHEKL